LMECRNKERVQQRSDDATAFHAPDIEKWRQAMSASLIGRLGSSAFWLTIHHSGVDIAHGLVLLFGIGTKALPAWDSRTRRNNLLVGLAVRLTAGSSGHANSPHPSSREGHHSTARWSS